MGHFQFLILHSDHIQLQKQCHILNFNDLTFEKFGIAGTSYVTAFQLNTHTSPEETPVVTCAIIITARITKRLFFYYIITLFSK